MSNDSCEPCQLAGQRSENAGALGVAVTCERCGTFTWNPMLPRDKEITPERRVRLSALIRQLNKAGVTPSLNDDLIEQIDRLPIPPLRERALRALAAMVEEVGFDAQSSHSFSDNLKVQALSYSANGDQLWLLLRVLGDDGLVDLRSSPRIHITVRGLLRAEELSRPGGAYLQGFVAMSFERSMDEAYTLGFYPAIKAAGYEPFRIDRKEHVNGISDEILMEIRRSRFLIADYTLNNNGVYFEAGFAIGLGLQVIPTCRADDMDKRHFDIRHINTLKWENPAHLSKDLTRRISAVMGEGPGRRT